MRFVAETMTMMPVIAAVSALTIVAWAFRNDGNHPLWQAFVGTGLWVLLLIGRSLLRRDGARHADVAKPDDGAHR